MPKFPHNIPLRGAQISEVTGDGRYTVHFEDDRSSKLELHGPFFLHLENARDEAESYEPPFAEWVRDTLEGLQRCTVRSARYSSSGELRLVFENGLELFVPDGPFENWHYSNSSGVSLHGGVGRVS